MAFRDLSEGLDKAWIAEWTRQEEKAMSERGAVMEIYDVAINEGNELPDTLLIRRILTYHVSKQFRHLRIYVSCLPKARPNDGTFPGLYPPLPKVLQ